MLMKELIRSNPNTGKIVLCKVCKQQREHHAKGLCFNCYRKTIWKPKIIICKNCGKKREHKAKGMCASCHMKVFHYDAIKASNYRKYHNISLELYKKITKECAVCGFNQVVDLHHLDKNHKNSNENNLIGLCPNHHKMLHNERFSNEIKGILKKKGYL